MLCELYQYFDINENFLVTGNTIQWLAINILHTTTSLLIHIQGLQSESSWVAFASNFMYAYQDEI